MQIFTDVEKEHEIVLVVVGEDDGSHVLDLVEAGLLVAPLCRPLERVNVVRGLHIDSLFKLGVSSRTDSPELLGSLSMHDHLIRGLELRDDLRSHQVVLLRLHHLSICVSLCRRVDLTNRINCSR